MKEILDRLKEKASVSNGVLLGLGLLAGVGMALLLVNIATRRAEGKLSHFRVTNLTEDSADPSLWAVNYPLQYAGYLKTADMQRTRYGGSEAVPHIPTDADPRSIVSQSKLTLDPHLKTIWAGYAFAIDFREERGHAYMLTDQLYTERQKVGQPGTCINCHASAYPAYRKLGEGDIVKGFHALNKMPYSQAKEHVEPPVACIDCHNPADMSLRVTRPAFMEGMRVYKESQGIKDYDVNRDASRLEMRSYVCGQCHVEYYFKGPEKTLTYPWHKGLKADQILDYYEEVGFKDWSHKTTGSPTLKAQHPEFELYNQGIHASSGVACADCHMPYQREGAQKVSDHHVRSPYLNTNAACGTCHKLSESELKTRIDTIQDRNFQMRNTAIEAVVDLIKAIEKAQTGGVSTAALDKARNYHRRAQFLADFVEAENSMGFHAPQEAARILLLSVENSRLGMKALTE